ncbi:MAG: acetolactate synthase small subunit [Hyphomonadaceae bacterium]|nr:acetolactate synthase small subunit [Clostridia bacterium]
MAKHIISIRVENQAGVLTRIAGLFSRRKFNIESLAVGVTEVPEVSRITILVDGDDYTVDQVIKQVGKLIDVKDIKQLHASDSISRELTFLKVEASAITRSEIMQIVDIFRAKIIDVSHTTLTIELTGSYDKVKAFIEMLEPFGIQEIVRTGTISIERGDKVLTQNLE